MQYLYEKIVLDWEMRMMHVAEHVRLGDKFLKLGMFKEAELSYGKAADMVRILTPSKLESMDVVARLAILGYANALLFQGVNFEEAANQFLIGLQYFSNFPLLPFEPLSFFSPTSKLNTSSNNSSAEELKNVNETSSSSIIVEGTGYDEVFSKLETLGKLKTSNPSLQFLLATQYHFLGRKTEAQNIFKELSVQHAGTMAKPASYFLTAAAAVSFVNDSGNHQLENTKTDLLNLPMDKVVNLIRQIFHPQTGIKIKDRKYRFKLYPKCFVASDLVTLVSNMTNTDRKTATLFIQKQIRGRWLILHCLQDHEFTDDYLFFNFQEPLMAVALDEKKYEGNLIWETKKIYAVLHATGLAIFEQKGGLVKKILKPLNSLVKIAEDNADKQQKSSITQRSFSLSSRDILNNVQEETFTCESEEEFNSWTTKISLLLDLNN